VNGDGKPDFITNNVENDISTRWRSRGKSTDTAAGVCLPTWQETLRCTRGVPEHFVQLSSKNVAPGVIK
jgi:hypothetical protein